MKIVYQDIWKSYAGGATICIPTNGVVKVATGRATMGVGVAGQAHAKFRNLSKAIGSAIRSGGNHVFHFPEYRMVSFPTKDNWWTPSRLDLIEQSARELKSLVQDVPAVGIPWLPLPGCGAGGLKWEDVERVIGPILDGFAVLVDFPRQQGDSTNG